VDDVKFLPAHKAFTSTDLFSTKNMD